MYDWYYRSDTCYVYLSDVAPIASLDAIHFAIDPALPHAVSEAEAKLRHSRWFTRGWTLQELIAPQNMVFFAQNWSLIGKKWQLILALSAITKIDEYVLRTGELSEASVARKMSWAADRKTSRGEDKAYCLLGLFNVNLPLLYGEGPIKAFRRLQEAIMKSTHDQSLFAWGHFVDNFAIHPPETLSSSFTPWEASEPQYGLFASSPSDFRESGDIVPVDHGYAHIIDRERPPTVLHGGALVNLVVYKTRPCVRFWDNPRFAWRDEVEIIVLMVHPNADSEIHLIAIALYRWGDGYCARTRELCSIKLFVSQYRFTAWTQQRHVLPPAPFELLHGDIFFRNWDVDIESAGFERPMLPSGPAWRLKWRDFVLRLSHHALGSEEARYRFKIDEGWFISVAFRRTSEQWGKTALGSLQVEALMHVPGLGPGSTRCFRHTLEQPQDAWTVVPEGGLQLEVSAKREKLEDGGLIDVVDMSLKRIGLRNVRKQLTMR